MSLPSASASNPAASAPTLPPSSVNAHYNTSGLTIISMVPPPVTISNSGAGMGAAPRSNASSTTPGSALATHGASTSSTSVAAPINMGVSRQLDANGNLVEFNLLSKLTCECGETVQVGTGGFANLARHRTSNKHAKNMAKLSTIPAVRDMKRGSILSFFSVKEKQTTSSSVQAPPPLVGPSAAALDAQLPSPRAVSPRAVPPLIARLREAISRIPTHVSEATPADELAAYAKTPVFPPDIDTEALWQDVDTTLNRLVGYLTTVNDVKLLIRCGPLGVSALCDWIETHIVVARIEECMFIGKVQKVIDAIDSLAAEANVHVGHAESLPSSSAAAAAASVIDLTAVDDIIMDEPPAPSEPIESTTSLASTAAPRDAQLPRCFGLPVALPSDQTPGTSYPWGLDKTRRYPLRGAVVDGNLYIQSTSCKRSTSALCCDVCEELADLEMVMNIIDRARAGTASEFMNTVYLSWDNMHDSNDRMRNQLNTQKLTGVALARRLTRLASTVSDYKRLVWAIATDNIPRVRVVLKVALNNKRGVRGLLAQVQKAATDVYKARSFTASDWALAILFKKMGGNSISELAHRALGLPSPESIRRHSTFSTIRISTAYPTLEDIIFNIDIMFPDLIRALHEPAIYGYIIMVDEVKNEERSAWDPDSNNIYGFCREHSDPFDVQFRSMAEPLALAEALRDGRVHLAKEMTVAAIGPLLPNPRDYVARPIHISGTCKSEDAGDHATLLETVLSAARNHPKLRNARPYSIASDGESKRGKALVKICLNRTLSRTSKLYPTLSKMPLMNLLCGEDDLTLDKDYKHVFKRMRSALLRKDGVAVYGVVITTQLLRQHLLDAGTTPELAAALLTDHERPNDAVRAQIRRQLTRNGLSESRVNALLNPNDKQDLPLAYSLLVAIMNLPEPEGQQTAAYQKVRKALNLLGYTFGCWIRPYTTLAMSVNDQFHSLSTAAHIWLALYADGRGQFVPVQLYGDAMHMFKNAAFTLAKMQVDNPRGDFYLCQEGSDELEKGFGNSRCMVGSDSNFDMVQGARRLSSSVEVAILFAEHPEWDRTKKRLHLAPLEEHGALVHRGVDLT